MQIASSRIWTRIVEFISYNNNYYPIPASIGIDSVIFEKRDLISMKQDFFQVVARSVLLYGYTTWTLIKHPKKKLDRNYTRMLHAVLNKSKKQQPKKQQLYGHLPLITQTIPVSGQYWRSKNELISNVLIWTLSYGYTSICWSAKIYIL